MASASAITLHENITPFDLLLPPPRFTLRSQTRLQKEEVELPLGDTTESAQSQQTLRDDVSVTGSVPEVGRDAAMGVGGERSWREKSVSIAASSPAKPRDDLGFG